MPVPPLRPPLLHGRVFRGTWAVTAGVLSEQQLRSSAWRRLRRDVYADAAVPVLLLHRSGLPIPIAQYEGRVGGRFIATVDFAWPERRLALEYDGIWHGDPDQFPRDRRRLNRLSGVDRRVHFATKGDVRRPRELLADVARALGV